MSGKLVSEFEAVEHKTTDIDSDVEEKDDRPGDCDKGCVIFTLNGIKYDNPLLNSRLFSEFAKSFGVKAAIDLLDVTSSMNPEVAQYLCNDPQTIKTFVSMMGMSFGTTQES